MSLEILTLVVLLMVLTVKYGTWKHMGVLNRERRELEATCQQNEHRYKQLAERREANEAEEQGLRQEKTTLEGLLEKLKGDVEAQYKENDQLKDRLG